MNKTAAKKRQKIGKNINQRKQIKENNKKQKKNRQEQ